MNAEQIYRLFYRMVNYLQEYRITRDHNEISGWIWKFIWTFLDIKSLPTHFPGYKNVLSPIWWGIDYGMGMKEHEMNFINSYFEERREVRALEQNVKAYSH